MLPYLYDRPVNTRRHPDGVDKKGFWQKAVPSHAPDWIERWNNTEADPGETEWYVVADSPPTLAWLANYGVIELHPWTSHLADVHEPTYALIDIDPGDDTTFDDVLTLARLYRTALDHVGVKGWPKVSGRRGLQIWVPIADGYTFDDTRTWVEALSRAVGQTVPDLVSWEWQVDKRRGRRSPGLHAERHQQDARRAIQPARGSRWAGVSADRLGRARRSRNSLRTDGRRTPCSTGSPRTAICSSRRSPTRNGSPTSDRAQSGSATVADPPAVAIEVEHLHVRAVSERLPGSSRLVCVVGVH